MKSLKVKKVILKNPHLRNLRKNLRIVLRLAIQDEIRRFSKIKNLYLQKGIQGRKVPSQRKREIQTSWLSDKLMHLEHRSCITCHEPYCIFHKNRIGRATRFDERSTDLDMVWIPWYEKWVCFDCYKHYHKDMTLDDFIDSKGETIVIFDENGMIERDLRQKFQNSFIHK